MEALSSSETSVLTRATCHNIPEDTILHSHHRENLKSYTVVWRILRQRLQLSSREGWHRKTKHYWSHLAVSLGFRFCINSNLYGYNCKQFLKIFLNVDSSTFSSTGLRHRFPRTMNITFMHSLNGLFGNTWSPCTALPLMTDAASVMKLLSLDGRHWRTTTSELQQHCYFLQVQAHTNCALSEEQPFRQRLMYARSARWLWRC
jgi:hypothetical protein